jgi:hypothetical protein
MELIASLLSEALLQRLFVHTITVNSNHPPYSKCPFFDRYSLVATLNHELLPKYC